MGSGSDRRSWQAVHDRLTARANDDLDASEIDELAQAFFWLNQPTQAIETHQLACRRWQADGRPDRAARSTWFLFYEHWLVGESAIARGWLERGRRLLEGAADADTDAPTSAAWLDIAEADVLAAEGRLGEAADRASRARSVGEANGDPDLTAMGLQSEGRMLVALGERADGTRRLDDAMVSVVANELQPLFTGWVYCNVIGVWHGLGDLERATQWTDAALRWCESIREGVLYPGICRVYAAELAQLRGRWEEAETLALRAAADLAVYDPRYAGAAHYVLGDLYRIQGRTDEANSAFAEAERLGRPPEPGRSLLRAAAGAPADALASLAPTARPDAPPPGSLLDGLHALEALIEVAEAAGNLELVEAACERVARLADDVDNDLTAAHGAAARAASLRADGDASAELAARRVACDRFDALGLPYDTARQLDRLADAARRANDTATAERAAAEAERIFDRLGVRRAAAETAIPPALAELSEREREVLALVASGQTNRAIAEELHLSPHTVARHLANIFGKLGVNSRTAASTIAVEAGLAATR